MRVTMRTINNNILSDLNRTTTDLARINNQISTGRQMSTLSDDPVNLTIALSLRTTLSTVGQYQENLSYGKSKINAAETSLTEVKTQIIRAKTLAIQAANSATISATGRDLIADEVSNLLEQTFLISNGEISGKYIFGGHRTSGYTAAEPAPFSQNRYDGYRINGNSLPTIDRVPLPPPSTPLAAGDITINGIAAGAAIADGTGLPYEDMSATATAKVVNDISSQTGVTANIIPASHQGSAPIAAGALAAGDLIINGIDIGGVPIIQANDNGTELITAINAQTGLTGVTASNNGGELVLSANDGRNIQIQTTLNGETVTSLNGGVPPTDKVYFGSLQLVSSEKFQLKTATGTDAELAFIGMDGGEVNTSEPDDIAGDGEIWVRAIANRDGSVRYNGDRINEIEIRISNSSNLAITKRGNEVFNDADIFTGLQKLEDVLRGNNFTEGTSYNSATAPGNTLGSGLTGLPTTTPIVAGSFDVTISDHDYYPTSQTTYTIPVDPAFDTPETIRQKLNGIPGLNASWDGDNRLHYNTTDQDRYTVAVDNDNTNTLTTFGLTTDIVQTQAIETSMTVMDNIATLLTNHISDFGARMNRLETQDKILNDIELSTTAALSERQDTDITEALMNLKTKEFAYSAALQTAAKTLQLSLVNFI